MGTYLAIVGSLVLLLFSGGTLCYVAREWRGGEERFLLAGLAIFAVGGTALLLPILWMMP